METTEEAFSCKAPRTSFRVEAPVEEVVKALEKALSGSQGRWLLNDTPTGPHRQGPLPDIQRGRCRVTGEGSESHDGARMAAAGQPSNKRVSVCRSLRAENKSEEPD